MQQEQEYKAQLNSLRPCKELPGQKQRSLAKWPSIINTQSIILLATQTAKVLTHTLSTLINAENTQYAKQFLDDLLWSLKSLISEYLEMYLFLQKSLSPASNKLQ